MKRNTSSSEVAILGLAQTGKTTYLAAIAKLMEDDSYREHYIDYGGSQETNTYLKTLCTELSARGKVEMTRPGHTHDLSFSIVHVKSGKALPIRTKDVSGEEVRDLFDKKYRKLRNIYDKSMDTKGKGKPKNILRLLNTELYESLSVPQKSIVQQLETTNKFIVFIDPNPALRRQQTVFLEKLVDILEVLHSLEGLKQIPIALLFTKADLYSEVTIPVAYLLKYYRGIFLRIVHKLPLLAAYAVSSTGGHTWFDSNKDRTMGNPITFNPRNVLEPIYWMFAPSENIRYLRPENPHNPGNRKGFAFAQNWKSYIGGGESLF